MDDSIAKLCSALVTNERKINSKKTAISKATVNQVRPYCLIVNQATVSLKNFIAVIFKILIRKEKVRMIILIILDLVIGLLDISFLGFLLLIVNFYTKDSVSRSFIFSTFHPNKNSLLLITIFFILFGLKNCFGYFISKAQNFFFYEVASRLSKQNIRQYLKTDYLKFVNVDSSIHIRKISQQPIEFSNYILTNVQQVISQVILIFFTVIAILFYHPSLFLSLFLLLLPPVILLGYFIRKKLRRVRDNTKITSEKTIQHLQESLAGYVESNIYNSDEFFINRYYSYQNQLNENIAIQQTLQGLPSRLIEIFAVLGFLILIAISKFSVNAPGINFINVGVFMVASYKIIPGIVKILNSTGQIKTYEFTMKDLSPIQKETHGTPLKLSESIYSISFKLVDFKYKHQQILQDFNLNLVAGDLLGISGKSGQGKTTIINLLLGFLESDSGKISINHKVTNSLERQHFWNKISYVKQQPFFINDSVLKNIVLTDKAYNLDEMNKVIAFCGIENIIDQYPEGLNKIITENGKNISGGQRQRIALARALYHDFDLLILDEPFSELDEGTEKGMIKKLEMLANEGKIIILITHSKATLSYCNKVLLLDEEYQT